MKPELNKTGERIWSAEQLKEFAKDLRGAAADLRRLIIKYPSLANILSDDAERYEQLANEQYQKAVEKFTGKG
jgi:C4-dicarboxylate-specific signal transduction histidine kinase